MTAQLGALRRFLAGEEGFTLLELELVSLILGILTAIALPTYLQSRDNAYKNAAASNVREAVVAAEAYGADNYPASSHDPDKSTSTTDSGFAGMTTAELEANYDTGLSSDVYVNNSGADAPGVTVRAALDTSHFCIYAIEGRWYTYQLNPTGAIYATTIPADVCT